MVDAQYRLVTEGLGIQHVRLLRRDQLDVAIRQGAQELAGLPIVSVGDPGATLVAAITRAPSRSVDGTGGYARSKLIHLIDNPSGANMLRRHGLMEFVTWMLYIVLAVIFGTYAYCVIDQYMLYYFSERY
jgi:hypothetical protein